MKRLAPLTTAILAAALAGCAATPRVYNQEESESRALNLARAGGIYDMDLRDSGDGSRSYSKGMLVPITGSRQPGDFIRCTASTSLG